MRTVWAGMLVALLLPAAAVAQKPGEPGAEVGRKVPVFRVSKDAAINTAVARVRSDLAAGKLSAWGGGQGGGIRPTAVAVKSGQVATAEGNYVVGVTAPNAPGHVRVVVNGQTGAVVSAQIASWDWGMSPDWWVKGLSSPPPAKAK